MNPSCFYSTWNCRWNRRFIILPHYLSVVEDRWIIFLSELQWFCEKDFGDWGIEICNIWIVLEFGIDAIEQLNSNKTIIFKSQIDSLSNGISDTSQEYANYQTNWIIFECKISGELHSNITTLYLYERRWFSKLLNSSYILLHKLGTEKDWNFLRHTRQQCIGGIHINCQLSSTIDSKKTEKPLLYIEMHTIIIWYQNK